MEGMIWVLGLLRESYRLEHEMVQVILMLRRIRIGALVLGNDLVEALRLRSPTRVRLWLIRGCLQRVGLGKVRFWLHSRTTGF
jgi:hypothetical protein